MKSNIEKFETLTDLEKLKLLSLITNDAIKWKEEHDRLTSIMNEKNNELENMYKIMGDIRQDIKYAYDNLVTLKDMAKIPRVKNEIDDILQKLKIHLPITLYASKGKQ